MGHVTVGGGAPIVVQSMTNTDTADVQSTLQQTLELAERAQRVRALDRERAGSRGRGAMIKQRLLDAGCNVPIIGDFHYNGHVLLTKYPACAAALDKYRINPGNVGAGQRRDEQFSTICRVAVDHGKPVRIGVNGGSLNQELVIKKMQENTTRTWAKTPNRSSMIAWCSPRWSRPNWRWKAGCGTIRSLFRARLRGRAT